MLSNKHFINIGYNNVIVLKRVIAIVNPDAAPVKRLKEEARRLNKLIDATNGRRTRAVIITDSDHVVLSSIQPETVAQRIEDRDE
ncbi:MAG: DUF370 domain-containing protein [PVC group bacterium]|nr:DUF370 domain-containing protein [PVC group bacterium]